MRADLLALTPEAIASLANVGLVKRATKELAAGDGPTLEEAPDGTVVGTFKDGVVARLPPGLTLRDAPCSCPAGGVCRHRVAVALAYPAWQATQAPAPVVEAWSPGELGDDELLAALGKRTLDRAKLAARGALVELTRGPVPEARLSTCTVRFLAPRELAFARCDCVVSHHCEHVAIAVWAFREAKEGEHVVVSLAAKEEVSTDPLEPALRLARELLVEGVVHAGASFAQRFRVAETAAHVWPLLLLEDLEAALEAYRSRSARYTPARVGALLVELEARARAARGAGELPARFVLGSDEAGETTLDHARLVSLGARLDTDGKEIEANVFLADPDTGAVFVLHKSWPQAEASELGRRQVAARIPLETLARGQVVSRALKRRANRAITIATARTQPTSVTPQTGDWNVLPTPLLVERLEAHRAMLESRPPRVLRPRLLAEDVHVVRVTGVSDVRYSPGRQALLATLRTADGEVRLVRHHSVAAPHAIDALGHALAGPVRFVSGELRRTDTGLELDPLAVVTDRLCVLDLEPPGTKPALALGDDESQAEPRAAALEAARGVLDDGVHQGLARVPANWRTRLDEQARRLESFGLLEATRRLSALSEAVRRLHAGDGPDEAALAWLEAALRLELTRERC